MALCSAHCCLRISSSCHSYALKHTILVICTRKRVFYWTISHFCWLPISNFPNRKKKKDRIEHFWKLLRLNLIFWLDSFHFLLRSPVQLMEIILWVSGWFQNQKGHRDTSCAVSKLETGYGGCVQRLSLSQPYAPECIINKVTRSVYLRLNSWERQSWLSVWGRAVLGIKKLFHLSWC